MRFHIQIYIYIFSHSIVDQLTYIYKTTSLASISKFLQALRHSVTSGQPTTKYKNIIADMTKKN
jgi:hypothetical protein